MHAIALELKANAILHTLDQGNGAVLRKPPRVGSDRAERVKVLRDHRQAKTDPGAHVVLCRDPIQEVNLVLGIDVDTDAELDGLLQLLLALVRAIHDDLLRISSAHKGRVELRLPEAVATS